MLGDEVFEYVSESVAVSVTLSLIETESVVE